MKADLHTTQLPAVYDVMKFRREATRESLATCSFKQLNCSSKNNLLMYALAVFLYTTLAESVCSRFMLFYNKACAAEIIFFSFETNKKGNKLEFLISLDLLNVWLLCMFVGLVVF